MTMKVLSLFGGPRKHGNTAAVLGWVEEELRNTGHSIERVDVADLSIGGCTGCWACMEMSDAPGCVIKDDATAILDKMTQADAILFASPLYAWSFAGQLKPLLDRCVCLVKDYEGPNYNSLIGGKRSGLIVTCGWGIENNADLIQGTYERIADYAQLVSVGELIIPNCTEPDQLSEDVKNQAKAFAQKLAA